MSNHAANHAPLPAVSNHAPPTQSRKPARTNHAAITAITPPINHGNHPLYMGGSVIARPLAPAWEWVTPRVELVHELHRDGHRLWRAELHFDGRLVDCTLFADSPVIAMRDGHALASRWARLRRLPDLEEVGT